MPRTKRHWVSQKTGSFHIISRTTGQDILFHDEEKDYFLKLLERFASGFFVSVHENNGTGENCHNIGLKRPCIV